MSKIINTVVVPYHNTGGHFFCWSLDFVSGYTNTGIENFNGKNWHHYKVPVAEGFNKTVEILDKLKLTENGIETLYIAQGSSNALAYELFNDSYENITHDQRQAVNQYRIDNFKETLEFLQENNHIPIILDCPDYDQMSIFYNNRHVVDWRKNTYNDVKSMINVFEDTFYPNAKFHFDNNIWDHREKLALVCDSTSKVKLDNLYDNKKPHLYYNTDDIWNKFDTILPEIFEVFNLPWNTVKFEQWKEVYKTWREVHEYSFSRHFDRIIDAIIDNKYLSLVRFNIDFVKEVLILQALIKRHNLNLKSWQLHKFPANTQDLHALLEPNIHSY